MTNSSSSSSVHTPPKGVSTAKNVLVITSHVVQGRVGLRAAAYGLERLGVSTWQLPTVMLPYHPGHGLATRLATDDTGFDALIDDLIASPWFDDLDGVLSGYLASAAQARSIAKLIDTLKNRRREAQYLCDPVMGDFKDGIGTLYIPQETAEAIRDELLPRADIITPNRFEFEWLTNIGATGKSSETNEELVEAARKLNPSLISITSAHAMMRSSAAALLIEKDGDAFLAEHRAFETAPNGLGDLFSGLFAARLIQGSAASKAFQTAVAGVFEVLAQTAKLGGDELRLIDAQDRLERPMAMVNMRRLGPGANLAKKGVRATPRPLT